MATITDRNGRFMARVRRDGFKAVTASFTRKVDAIAWARRVEASMENGSWVEASNKVPTFKEGLSAYRVAVVDGLKGAEKYSYWLDELEASALASKKVNEVTSFALAAWRDEQASRHAPGTVARKLGLVSGFLTWCQQERGWIATNPMQAVRKPRVNDSRDRVLSDEERRYLLAAAATSKAAWLGDALVVLLRSAMRRGELFGLRAGDVDLERSVAHLADTKNGSARDVPLCTQAAEALQRLMVAAVAGADEQRQRGKPAPAKGAEPLLPVSDPAAVSLAFRRTVARAQAQYLKDCERGALVADEGFLVDFRLHDVRHCAATMWASTGALSLPELMAVTGHKTPRMLTRYINLSAQSLAAKMATLAA